MPARGMSGADRFEQSFVFKIARWLPLTLAGLASLGLLAALLAGTFSFAPVAPPAPETAVPPPAAVAVSAREVADKLKPAAAAEPKAVGTVQHASGPIGPSAAAMRLASAIQEVRGLLEAGGASWNDVYTTVCTYRGAYSGDCYSYDYRRTAIGHSGRLDEVLELYDAGAVTEKVEITASNGAKRSYSVNASNAEQKLAAVQEAAAVLKTLEPKRRGQGFRTWAELRKEKEQQRAEAIAAEQQRVARIEAARQADYDAAVASRAAMRRLALTGIAGTLGLIFAVGTVLALLAIERNTRALQALIDRSAPASAS